MCVNPDDFNLIIEHAIQKVLQTNQYTTSCYKTLNKHENCSKCSTLITTEIYKKIVVYVNVVIIQTHLI